MDTFTLPMCAAPQHLLQLPTEVRYHIYHFVFKNADFGFSREHKLYIKFFPIALNATCHLLRAEVEQYLAHYLWIRLDIESTTIYRYAQLVIPQRYLARVFDVATSYDDESRAEIDAFIHMGLGQLSEFHNLKVVFFRINAQFIECSNWELAILGVGPRRTKDQIVANDALRILDGIEHMRLVVDRCCWIGVKVEIEFCLGYGKNNVVSRCFWVMIVNVLGSREIVWATGKKLKYTNREDVKKMEKIYAFETLIGRPGVYIPIFSRKPPPVASGVSLT